MAGGYVVSQRLRKRIEEIFGWSKDGRALRKMRVRGLPSVAFMATLTIGCDSMLRLAKPLPDPALAEDTCRWNQAQALKNDLIT